MKLIKAIKTSKAAEKASTPGKKRSETQDRLIQCAIDILINQGNEALTLDAVAHAAKVSKGGLLYHFPNKEALITGIIQHLIDGFNAAIESELAKEKGDEPGKWLRAYVRATFNSSQLPLALGSSLFAAVSISLNPETAKQIDTQISEWQHKLYNCGLDPVQASIVHLATEGLWATEMFEINAPNQTLRKQILKRLLDMTREAH
ncbi:TetR/AcrR family transcriptional regulator [Leptolyngbya sp. FACHB-261]|uniref:TetR/AcrR family transcriptional regulator n=1 Tax=Leptolyngbya sp. FACHB-261 TaxID=2692806 RepID=UPI0016880EEC|nr:TetR/AcrR family transcriptional regulator [Leptolyngbya sp. FACHB-261]MBD2099990.1 TetR/AcrR family transcriptional regulator [Leptolyngbya sp. FACHB-261]